MGQRQSSPGQPRARVAIREVLEFRLSPEDLGGRPRRDGEARVVAHGLARLLTSLLDVTELRKSRGKNAPGRQPVHLCTPKHVHCL